MMVDTLEMDSNKMDSNKRVSNRPYDILKHQIFSRWEELANKTKNTITIDSQIFKGKDYAVTANIMDNECNIIAEGNYESRDGKHAEISAIENCVPRTDPVTLSVNVSPCKRCAAVLYFYKKEHKWIVKAPEQTFASTYKGSYYLPDTILEDFIISDLIDNNLITQDEAKSYKGNIKRDFCTADW